MKTRSFDCAPFVPLAQDDISQRRERKDSSLPFPMTRPSDVFWDIRNLNRRGSTLWRPLVSVDLTADEISATGSPRRFALHALTLGRNDSLCALLCYMGQLFLALCPHKNCGVFAPQFLFISYLYDITDPILQIPARRSCRYR